MEPPPHPPHPPTTPTTSTPSTTSPNVLSSAHAHPRSAASADSGRPVDPVEPRQRGSQASRQHHLSRLPVASRPHRDSRARGDAAPRRSGRPRVPAGGRVRVSRDRRVLPPDRRRAALEPGDLRRSHPRRGDAVVGPYPAAARAAAGEPHRLAPHPRPAAAPPLGTRRRDARALLRRPLAGGVLTLGGSR